MKKNIRVVLYGPFFVQRISFQSLLGKESPIYREMIDKKVTLLVH